MEPDCNTCEHIDKKISQLPCLYCDNGNQWEPEPKKSIGPQLNGMPFTHGKRPDTRQMKTQDIGRFVATHTQEQNTLCGNIRAGCQ